MLKASSTEFKFRKSDNIGAASAEEDTEFLRTCFVQTDEYEAIKDLTSIRHIVLGRTGSGKSALFERLKQEYPQQVIAIEPHELALTYVSNSSVIRYFSDLGVNLDPFYKLLWRHVLTVEILRRHFDPRLDDADEAPTRFWSTLTQRFSSHTRKDTDAKQAIEYLQKWGAQFWLQVEYRVKEITSKMENDLANQLSGGLKTQLLSGEYKGSATSLISDEEKIEVINRGQHVVSEAQVQDLSKVHQLLEAVLTDRQKMYYILIDRLDENWVEQTLRYRLIMALLDSVRALSRGVTNLKVMVAIRRDLIDRVFRLVQDAGAGFQEEKYQSLYLPLNWSSSELISVLDKRIDALVARRYQKKQAVTHLDILPQAIDRVPTTEFITRRAKRPRDIITFFNKCIEAAEGKARVSVDVLRRAEGEYSRQRLRALGDEWHTNYPGLLFFADILKKRSSAFSIRQVDYNAVADLCLNSAIRYPSEDGLLRTHARTVVEGLEDVGDFKKTLFMVFYRVGLVGLKLETFQTASWVDESGQSVSPSEIDEDTGVVVHTTYWRALGIVDAKRRR